MRELVDYKCPRQQFSFPGVIDRGTLSAVITSDVSMPERKEEMPVEKPKRVYKKKVASEELPAGRKSLKLGKIKS